MEFFTFTPKSNQELYAAIQVYRNMDNTQKIEYWNQPDWIYGKFSDWDVSNITSMSRLFDNILFNQNISNWNVSNVTNMDRMFALNVVFNQDLSNWNVSNVTSMEGMFQNCTYFNKDLSSWGPKLGNVTNMKSMFQGCKQFNQPLNWNVSNVSNMESMFQDCIQFNQPLNSWNVSKVTNMSAMFQDCIQFNHPLNSWDVSKVTNMSAMFQVTNMSAAMFHEDNQFNQPLNSWNVSNVTNMESMFSNCYSFNQPLNSWDVSKVTNMKSMFNDCYSFNQPLNSWDVSNVTNMKSMFQGCTQFNQPLNMWGPKLSKVTNMGDMFQGCTQFNKDLNSWVSYLDNVTEINNIFSNTSVSKSSIKDFIKLEPKIKEKNQLQEQKIRDESVRPSITLKEVEFSDNVDDYKKIKEELYQVDNPYKIHIETVDNHEFPIITLPKGLMLYTYSHETDVYNLNTKPPYYPYSSDLKFFYPIPYYAMEIYPYKKCHMCVLNRDIRLFAAMRPSPINLSDLLHLEYINLKVNNPDVPTIEDIYQYYPEGYSKQCPRFIYDPCISNELKQKLNIDGYIGISRIDSPEYKFKNVDSSTFDINVVKKLFAISALNSSGVEPRNFNIRGTELTDINSIFGIPEIVLNLYDNQQFGAYSDKLRPKTMDDIKELNMNFKQVLECDIKDVEKTISDLGNKIVFTKQAPILFHLHRDYIDNDSSYNKYLVEGISDFNFPDDLDYIKDEGPSLEMMGYKYPILLEGYSTHYISKPLRKGGEYHNTVFDSLLDKHNIPSNKPTIDSKPTITGKPTIASKPTITGKPTPPLFVSETSQGIPVVYPVNNTLGSTGGKRKTRNKKHKKRRYTRTNKK